MLLTKIKIFSQDNVISRLCSEMHVHVDILKCRENGSDGGLSILRIDSEPTTTAEDIKKWFTGSDGCSVVSLAAISSGKYIATVRNPRCTLCQAFVGTECFLESGCSATDDSVIWKIYSPDNISLKGMIERIRNQGCKVELLSVKRAASSFELTWLQDDAIRLALSMGYYDIPKGITLEELAVRSGVSKATLNLILRRGQKKIISERLN